MLLSIIFKAPGALAHSCPVPICSERAPCLHSEPPPFPKPHPMLLAHTLCSAYSVLEGASHMLPL